MSTKPKCADCRYFAPIATSEVHGFCRRNAPKVEGRAIFASAEVIAVWPRVQRKEWCGEFVARRRQRVKGR